MDPTRTTNTVQISIPWFSPCWPIIPTLDFQRISFSCWSPIDSEMKVRSSAFIFPVKSCTKLLIKGFQCCDEQLETRKETYEFPLSISGCNQQALWICHFHTWSVWDASATPQRQVCEEPTGWHFWVDARIPSPDRRMPCSVSCRWPKLILGLALDGMELFLQLAFNEYGVSGAASKYEAKLYVTDAHLS